MQNRIRFLFLPGFLVLALTLTAAGLYAQQAPRPGLDGPGFMPGGGFDFMSGNQGVMQLIRMAEELELSRDQRDAILKLTDAARPKTRDNLFKLMDARKEMRDMLDGGEEINDRKLRSLTKEQGDAMAEMMYLQVRLRTDINNVLNDEQQAKLKNIQGRVQQFREPRPIDRMERVERFRNRGQQTAPDREAQSQ